MNGASSKALPMKLIGRWWVADKYSRGITFPRRGRWIGANDRVSLFWFSSRYWPISSIVIKLLFFVHVFDVYGASVEFSFWFLQENKLFFLLSLVIEPRPVFSRVFVPMRSAYRVVTTVLMKFNCRRKKGSICRPPRCSRCVYRSSWETEASVVVCSWFPYLTLRTELSVSEFCLCRNCCFPTTTSFPSIKAESRLKATVMENITILPKIPFQCKKEERYSILPHKFILASIRY